MRGVVALIFLLLTVSEATLNISAKSAVDFFTTAPDNIIRLLPQSTRLDMVDYFTYGSSRASSNYFGGNARVTEITENTVSAEIDKDVTMQVAVIPCGKDSIIALITTVYLPAPDSSIKFYTKEWKPLAKPPFRLPEYKDWLTKTGSMEKEEVMMHLPFMPVSARFNGDASELTLTNNADVYLSNGIMKNFEGKIIRQMTYSVKGGRFNLKK